MGRTPRDAKYVTEEYQENIEAYAALYPEYDADTITEVFRHDCRNFDDIFVEDSLTRVRSVAWKQTKHRLDRDNIPDDIQSPDS